MAHRRLVLSPRHVARRRKYKVVGDGVFYALDCLIVEDTRPPELDRKLQKPDGCCLRAQTDEADFFMELLLSRVSTGRSFRGVNVGPVVMNPGRWVMSPLRRM